MLRKKLKNKDFGILLYGITPPKSTNNKEELKIIAAKHIQRIKKLDIDALVLYDIQDESARTSEIRPFSYIKTIDPYVYKNKYLQELKVPSIIYRSVGKYTKKEFKKYLEETNGNKNNYSVFVGAASKEQKINITIKEAYKIKKEVNKNLFLGGITIPERHTSTKEEHLRVFSKMSKGCEYFITQCVYNLEATKIFLSDYAKYAKDNNIKLVPIIITLTPCGSLKTLEFMKWLGINIPNYLEEDLIDSKDILQESIDTCLYIFEELYKFAIKRNIPLGCNVESVAIRKVEIDASIFLLQEVKKVIKKYKKITK
ncbi:MAG: methylenetetrahydrofolate reductase [Campylobacteraceae bacterium]|nr:methylenetetrahydrofolate reductase [Campylobacteraceae bacterium]